jgi:hypothetical protein
MMVYTSTSKLSHLCSYDLKKPTGFFFFFLRYWGLKKLWVCLSHALSPFIYVLFCLGCSQSWDLPRLHLQGSWDYRYAPTHSAPTDLPRYINPDPFSSWHIPKHYHICAQKDSKQKLLGKFQKGKGKVCANIEFLFWWLFLLSFPSCVSSV